MIQSGLFLIAFGQLAIGCYFIRTGLSRELRQTRRDEETFIRTDKVDGNIQIACFVFGALFIVVGLFMMTAPALV
jgi:hypothetical protein